MTLGENAKVMASQEGTQMNLGENTKAMVSTDGKLAEEVKGLASSCVDDLVNKHNSQQT